MNFLHVLPVTGVSGSETFTAALCDKQIESGHKAFIVTGTFGSKTKADVFFQPIFKRSFVQRIKNIHFLIQKIRRHEIDAIFSHGRASAWVAHFASKWTGIPHIGFAHGRQHLHFTSKNFSVLGDHVISVCENLGIHLIEEVFLPKEKITIIHNGFDFNKLLPIQRKNKRPVLSLIGRLNGPKGELVAHLLKKVFPALLYRFPDLQIRIVGGPLETFKSVYSDAFNESQNSFSDRIVFTDFLPDLQEEWAQASLIMGAGRVAIEALGQEIPVLAIGEGCSHGIVTRANFQKAKASNFGDMMARQADIGYNFEEIRKDLISFFENESMPENISDLAKMEFGMDGIASEIETLVQKVRILKYHPKHIPVLMYHRVTNTKIDSEHRIFVTKDLLRKHFSWLKLFGKTPITFHDYHYFKIGKKSLTNFPKRPVILTFDDAYLDNYTNLFPLLKKYNYKAVIFALGDSLKLTNFWDVAEGEPEVPLMSLKQKKEMLDWGVEFGAHSMNHKNLTELSEEAVFEEIYVSKQVLEKELQTKVISFAYPYGKYNDDVKALVKRSQIPYSVVIDSGGMTIEDDPLAIFRAYIFPEDGFMSYYKKTSNWYRSYFKRKRGR